MEMAWPCISRVCCLARFWEQFDKSDLSVPLTIQNYSDIAEHEVRSVTKQVTASERAPANDYSGQTRATGSADAHADAPGPRGSCRTRRDKYRENYNPHGVPFQSVSQYKQDYKPWPIPRKDNFPWISNETSSDSPHRGNTGQQAPEPSPTSSYRQEFRPWTGVKPAKSSRKNLPIHCATPGTEATHVAPETSYQAAYSGDSLRSAGPYQGDTVIASASSNALITPPSHISSSSQHTVPPEKQEHLVRTKQPPNPSAVFQSGSRVFNI